jgi:hypothetical protein
MAINETVRFTLSNTFILNPPSIDIAELANYKQNLYKSCGTTMVVRVQMGNWLKQSDKHKQFLFPTWFPPSIHDGHLSDALAGKKCSPICSQQMNCPCILQVMKEQRR